MDVSKLKPEPIERNNKINVPKELKKVEPIDKPTISLNASDRFNQLLKWLSDAVKEVANGMAGQLIPFWFFIAIIIILAIFLFK